jgi:tRNA pseudouridine38-40 synthase
VGRSSIDGRNIRLLLEYDGTNFSGWQSQADGHAIQDHVEAAIFRLTQEKVRITGAGRTDAGVHARGQVVNFPLSKALPVQKIFMGLNFYLPDDIVVKKAEEVPEKFNARFDARRRVYQYFISPERTAVSRNFCWQLFVKLDFSLLQTLAGLILGGHDFSSFSRLEAQAKNRICKIYESDWRIQNGYYIYRIVANRFLHGMVRTLVGTMVDVARGRFSREEFEEIFQSQDREKAGQTAPARGLFLEEVIY